VRQHPVREVQDFPPALLKKNVNLEYPRPAPNEHRAAVAFQQDHAHRVVQDGLDPGLIGPSCVPRYPTRDVVKVGQRGFTHYDVLAVAVPL
jgi:hypothetical protein